MNIYLKNYKIEFELSPKLVEQLNLDPSITAESLLTQTMENIDEFNPEFVISKEDEPATYFNKEGWKYYLDKKRNNWILMNYSGGHTKTVELTPKDDQHNYYDFFDAVFKVIRSSILQETLEMGELYKQDKNVTRKLSSFNVNGRFEEYEGNYQINFIDRSKKNVYETNQFVAEMIDSKCLIDLKSNKKHIIISTKDKFKDKDGFSTPKTPIQIHSIIERFALLVESNEEVE